VYRDVGMANGIRKILTSLRIGVAMGVSKDKPSK
jgi:hypothetical protein